MGVGRVTTADIAVSGLQAEALRLKVIAQNIANANTTRAENGKPFRRQHVMVAAQEGLSGVKVQEVVADSRGGYKDVYMPGHPDANKDGMVRMPNVDLPVEMMNMMVASRAYQANAAVLKRFTDAMNVTLELLK
jgi:flagellar basal-body rod protein FlgC